MTVHKPKAGQFQNWIPLATCLGLSLSISTETFGFRSAVYPNRFESRTVFFPEFNSLLKSEKDLSKPIWIQGGDSLSTGWAHAASLVDRIELIRQEKSPDAGTADDLKVHTPRTNFVTWYGGSENEKGFIDFLEAKTQSPWLTLSSALTGAFLFEPRNDNLENMQKPTQFAEVKDQIRMVSFSLGANDICELRDPTVTRKKSETPLQKRLQNFKRSFADQTQIIAWAPPKVHEMKKNVFGLIERALKDSPQKDALLNYCRTIWTETFCFGGTDQNLQQMKLIGERIHKAYINAGFKIFDPWEGLFDNSNLSDMEKLELIGSDCFHPSHLGHKLILKKLTNFIETETPDVLKP